MKLDGLSPEAIAQLKALEVNGRLTPDAVVSDAQNPNSPLHDFFDWNDRDAAERWRLTQARTLIRAVRVVWTTETSIIRSVYYVRDPNCEPNEQGYIAVPELVGERELAMRTLGHELDRIESAVERARGVAGVLGLEDTLDAMLVDVLRHVAVLRKVA